jgi:sulfite exporter TauE/SafE/copper chaperone CopZ
MTKTVLKIRGMHCKSCETLIREKLEELKDVESAKVSLKTRSAEVHTKYQPDTAKLENAVREAGYEVGEEIDRSWISRNPAVYRELGIALALVIVLYAAGSWMGLFNLNLAGAGTAESLWAPLLVGLTAGFSTCMALVGGLVLAISARHSDRHPEAGAMMKFRPHLFFNAGRIAGFFVLGGLIGALGGFFKLSGVMLGVLMIFVGLVMAVLGLNLIGIFPKLSGLSLALPGKIFSAFRLRKKSDGEYSHLNSFLLGAGTFFLPCGFTQAMQIYAVSTGSFWAGGLTMAVFALGTAPGLLGVGGLTAIVKGAFARVFYKFAGVLVIVFALVNISGGYNLTGWTFGAAASSIPDTTAEGTAATGGTAAKTNVTIEDGVQVARMEQNTYGFFPNKFTVRSGMPVKWVIFGTDQYSCSSSIVASKIGVSQNLKMGENVIEFTPDKPGTIRFSCGMGMYPGEFTVI